MSDQTVRVCIDEDCPACEWPERWYLLPHGPFGCSKCDYRSEYRDQ